MANSCLQQLILFLALLMAVTEIFTKYPDCYTCTIFNRRACCAGVDQRCCNLTQRNDSECPSTFTKTAPECKRFRCLADGQCPPGYKCCQPPETVCMPNGSLVPTDSAGLPEDTTKEPPQCPISLSAYVLSSLKSCDSKGECADSHRCCPLPTAFNMGCCIQLEEKGTSLPPEELGSNTAR